tara:strand:- start:7 stop:540 length:534 start_codon:yes stop_codon:yes gene_type:complete
MRQIFLIKKIGFLFLISSLIISSCSNKIESTKKTSPKIINLKDNFTIEGKFRVKYEEIKESGYFKISKQKEQVKLGLGKTFLFPYKELVFDIDQDIKIQQFLSPYLQDEEKLKNQKINIKNFLSYLLISSSQKKSEASWYVSYSPDVSYVNGYKIPSRIKLTKNDINIEVLIKKIDE